MSKKYLWWITKLNSKYIADFLQSIDPEEDYEIITQTKKGKSLAWAWNQGLKKIGEYKAVIITNDDVVVKSETGKRITEILDKVGRKTKTLIVSAYDINLSGDQGNIWVPSKVNYPQSFCFAVDERLKETVGEFDERFWPYLFEDTDMFRRIQIAGYDWASAVPVWHVGGGSITTEDLLRLRKHYFETNRTKYIHKWGGPPGQETLDIPDKSHIRVEHNGR